MGLFENFPYANFHELNLDWILHKLKDLETEITNFVTINSVKYANPIIWDITSQYETNTVVIDSSGNAYLSVQPVPSGVSLDREEYWTKIGNFSALWDSVRSAITPYDEQHNTTASVNHKVGDWVWLKNDLLMITKNMNAGDKYVEGSNCKKTNVHDLFVTLDNTITNEVNTLSRELQDEITARESGDSDLDAKIIAEATARAEADTQLKEELKAAENIVFFEKHGAVGDGVTDDTGAIKAAVADAENTGKILASLAKTYFVTDTIAIDCHKVKNINITGTIKASFADRTILKLYTSAPEKHTNAVINCKVDGTNGFGGYQFPAADEGFNFPSFAMRGIELLDINRSVINCSSANCAAGIVLTNSSNHGVVFNTVNIGAVYNCVVSLSLEPANGGWVNSNTFVGGGFQINSEFSAYNKRTITIRLLKEKHGCNSNTFIAPSFETGGLPLLFSNCQFNIVRFCRNENDTDYIAKFDGDAEDNIVETLYGQILPSAIGSAAANNTIKTALTEKLDNAICIKKWDFDKNKCFNVGTRGAADSSTIIDGVDYVNPANVFTQPRHWSVNILADGLEISGNNVIGCLVDTHYAKTFFISATDNAIPIVVPMNDNKEPIDEKPITPDYGTFWKMLDFIGYTTSPLVNGDCKPFTVTDSTKYVFIGFSNLVKSFSIYTTIAGAQTRYGRIPNIIKLTSDIGARKIPNSTITSKCDTGTMLPACDPTGTALAYICTDGATQTWTAINKPS